jgi:hypothetical protein
MNNQSLCRPCFLVLHLAAQHSNIYTPDVGQRVSDAAIMFSPLRSCTVSAQEASKALQKTASSLRSAPEEVGMLHARPSGPMSEVTTTSSNVEQRLQTRNTRSALRLLAQADIAEPRAPLVLTRALLCALQDDKPVTVESGDDGESSRHSSAAICESEDAGFSDAAADPVLGTPGPLTLPTLDIEAPGVLAVVCWGNNRVTTDLVPLRSLPPFLA